MIDHAEFARRIRAARAYLGLNLKEAGALLGLTPHQLSRRERADVNEMQLTVADRFHISAVYCERTGWPVGFFTDEVMPPIPLRESVEDDLEPADVVELVEADLDDGGGAAERP
jgi:transcriptional regulator with XRE-family HTH domain